MIPGALKQHWKDRVPLKVDYNLPRQVDHVACLESSNSGRIACIFHEPSPITIAQT